MHAAMRSRLGPFQAFVPLLRSHLVGVLAWTRVHLSNGAVEGMNNQIKLISHRALRFRHAGQRAWMIQSEGCAGLEQRDALAPI